ncbi:unnamed protein product, partial [Iphiclides podalirius]
MLELGVGGHGVFSGIEGVGLSNTEASTARKRALSLLNHKTCVHSGGRQLTGRARPVPSLKSMQLPSARA